MKTYLFFFIFFLISYGSLSQNDTYFPSLVQNPIYFDISPPLVDMIKIQPPLADNSWKEVRNFFNFRKNQNKKIFPQDWVDPVVQNNNGFESVTADTTIQNFDGNTNTQGYYPPDTHGDVGPNHYFQIVNCHFSIYNKTGTLLLGPTSNSTLWSGMPNNSNGGDGVVVYDEQADRWLVAQLSYPNGTTVSPFLEMIAVSMTPDPTGSWYRWEYTFTDFPDYPKFGVWPDGYYMSINRFSTSGAFNGIGAVAFDRSAMIAGNSTPQMVYFTLPSSNNASSILPSDCDGAFPAAGTPDYFTYMWDGPDYLGIYEFHVDWTTPTNSTFGNYLQLPVSTFNDVLTGIPQKGTTNQVDPLSDRLMYRLEYRKFNDHQSMVVNHTVNVGSGVAGIRWYELRKTSGAWFVYQHSTYSPDGNCRWMGSIAIDTSGNIALGYSVSSSTLYPSIRYTGRLKNDYLNMMTIGEKGIINGGGSETGGGSPGRWGDYSSMTVDPSTSNFWYTQEYFSTSSPTTWNTRIASFSLGLSGIWSGNNSSNWNTASNWFNNSTPSATNAITIPNSAPNWPTYPGNLTVGSQCQNITINGSGQLSVNGSLTINQGNSITLNGSPVLHIAGNWTDYGKLNSGTGTIEFTGSSPSILTGGISPITYIQNYMPVVFTKGMTLLTGATLGPSGSNNASIVNIGFTFNYLGVNYLTAWICTNGWISFNPNSGTSYDNSTLFTITAPNCTLAPWFDRITVDGSSSLSYKTEGTIPNRVFTVEWKNVPTYYTGPGARINFQVKLYETSNVIEFQYGDLVSGTHSSSESASIGIEDATGGSGHFIEATTGSMTTGVTTLVSTSDWPPVNYRFTPPPLKETFYNLTNSKNNTSVTIQPDIIVNGNLKINP